MIIRNYGVGYKATVVFLRFSLMAETHDNHSRERKKNLDDSYGDIILHSRVVALQKKKTYYLKLIF
jgi:hypothetical protein